MKKILLAVAITVSICFAANAQSDGFFRQEDADNLRYTDPTSGENFVLPSVHGTGNDYNAPLGGGLLILTALGAGYIVRQKSKN